MMPTLKEIDLSKRRGCRHPDIRADGTYYLARIGDAWTPLELLGGEPEGGWFCGDFSMQHYGLNFNAVYPAGYQLDYGDMQELYEIVEAVDEQDRSQG